MTVFLETAEGENDWRNALMINLHKSNAIKLGCELVTPGSANRHATDCAMEPSYTSGLWNYHAQLVQLVPFP